MDHLSAKIWFYLARCAELLKRDEEVRSCVFPARPAPMTRAQLSCLPPTHPLLAPAQTPLGGPLDGFAAKRRGRTGHPPQCAPAKLL